ncbi:DUF6092 family protein [Pseudothermotoga elfii]|nr:DUF6092 family protein [Pseudothermotoga elfii]
MEVGEAILKRRSVRFFNDHEIDISILHEILISGIYAPTAGNLQVWEFYCYFQKNTIDRIKSCSPGILGNPKAIIVACVNERRIEELKLKDWTLNAVIDVSMACQNIMLKAFELGIGSCPVTSFEKDTLTKILSLSSYLKPLILIALGYYDKLPETPARDESVIHIEAKNQNEPTFNQEIEAPQRISNFPIEMLGFLITSVKINVREPPSYAVIRLLEAAEKICEYLLDLYPEHQSYFEFIKNELNTASSLYFLGNATYIEHLEKALDVYVHLLSSLENKKQSENSGRD